MSRPTNLATKIFLDSGDPQDTRKALDMLGFLDGQTTNPSLVAKNPEIAARIASGQKFSEIELLDFYQKTVKEISDLMPEGSVSIEVYADKFSGVEDLLVQARQMNSWIPNAHIKLPTIPAGLEASEILVSEKIKLNLTLCFTQAQAGAVYSSTKGASKGDIFYSQFVGRLFDKNINGLVQLRNVLDLYKKGDGHVEVLGASFRSYDQFLGALSLKPDILTVPLNILSEWAEKNLEIPENQNIVTDPNLIEPPLEEFDLSQDWQDFDITNEQTEAGLQKFADDWNGLLNRG